MALHSYRVQATKTCQACRQQFGPSEKHHNFKKQLYCSRKCYHDAIRATPESAIERFWAKVDGSAGSNACWPWTASIKPLNGYGHYRVGKKDHNAHRYAYQHSVGPIPAGKHVLHHCDKPACCNPSHLWLGTPADNALDKARKFRAKGHMTAEQVREARELFGKIPYTEIAAKFGVDPGVIYGIASGRNYAHVESIPHATGERS